MITQRLKRREFPTSFFIVSLKTLRFSKSVVRDKRNTCFPFDREVKGACFFRFGKKLKQDYLWWLFSDSNLKK